jgi:hypothetical protein
MQRESGLTTPCDRNLEKKFEFDVAEPLTQKQLKNAMRELNSNSTVKNFPQLERRYIDPPILQQRIGLFSFVPAKGASPNPQGIYGFAKLRGNFDNEIDADAQAEKIIRDVDSYHKIFHTFVGKPFPVTTCSDFSGEISQIDLKKSVTDSFSQDVKKKREEEQKQIEEIQQKEKELLEDVKKDKENPDDAYTTLRVKKAQLTWTYVETEKKLKQMSILIAKARKAVEEMDDENPEFKNVYYKKYMDARNSAGIVTDTKEMQESFMKYLVEDLQIPAVDEDYNNLYSNTL